MYFNKEPRLGATPPVIVMLKDHHQIEGQLPQIYPTHTCIIPLNSLKDDPSKFCVMPKTFIDNGFEKIKNMEVFEDDIWIVTFPKCGTTWVQEMIWMIGNDLDYETSMKVKLTALTDFHF